jgi:hypothetical protein
MIIKLLKNIDSKTICVIIIGLIIGISILGYGYMDYRYKTNRDKQRAESLKDCDSEAFNKFQINWQGDCKENGVGEFIDCKLPQSHADKWQQELKDDKERCVKLYGGQ